MSTEWVEIEISDFGKIITGKTPPTVEEKYFNGNYKFVSPRDLDFDSRYISSTITTITSDAIKKFKNQVIPKNTIMFTALSYGFGKIGIASDLCLTNQQINSVMVDDAKHDFNFVYYLFRAFREYFLTFNSGIVTPIIPKSTFSKIKVFVPKDKAIQRKIAAILSAYDDLIENNLQRIKLLEEMAQITYEEWFVRMKFPGHETAQWNKETGLPEGWSNLLFGDVCGISGGGTPSREVEEYWANGEISWFSPTDLSKAKNYCVLDSSQKITDAGLKGSSAKLLGANSFMMTSRATIGLFALIDKPFCTNQGFINITPKSPWHKLFLFFNLKNRVDELHNHASGATFPEISRSTFKKLSIFFPSEKILEEFDSSVAPLVSTMMNLTKQNELLREAREILLPRLMTGVIDVDQVEVPEALLARVG